MLCRADGFVFKSLADGKRENAGQSANIQPDTHVHAVIEIKDVPMADHAESRSLNQKIPRIDHPVGNREIRRGLCAV